MVERASSPTTPGAGQAGLAVPREASEDLRSTRDMVKAGASQLMDDALGVVRGAIDERKHRAAESLHSMAGALHGTARNLSGDQGWAAQYVDLAADQVERAGRLLRERDWDGLVDDAEAFARRQPALFIGGALAAGFLLARFLKSTEQRAAPARTTATATATTTTTAGTGTGAYAGTAAPGYGATSTLGGEL